MADNTEIIHENQTPAPQMKLPAVFRNDNGFPGRKRYPLLRDVAADLAGKIGAIRLGLIGAEAEVGDMAEPFQLLYGLGKLAEDAENLLNTIDMIRLMAPDWLCMSEGYVPFIAMDAELTEEEYIDFTTEVPRDCVLVCDPRQKGQKDGLLALSAFKKGREMGAQGNYAQGVKEHAQGVAAVLEGSRTGALAGNPQPLLEQ